MRRTENHTCTIVQNEKRSRSVGEKIINAITVQMLTQNATQYSCRDCKFRAFSFGMWYMAFDCAKSRSNGSTISIHSLSPHPYMNMRSSTLWEILSKKLGRGGLTQRHWATAGSMMLPCSEGEGSCSQRDKRMSPWRQMHAVTMTRYACFCWSEIKLCYASLILFPEKGGCKIRVFGV